MAQNENHLLNPIQMEMPIHRSIKNVKQTICYENTDLLDIE